VERFSKGVGRINADYGGNKNTAIELAGEITRRKGEWWWSFRGAQYSSDVYYKKELDIECSMSYGPGRYDLPMKKAD